MRLLNAFAEALILLGSILTVMGAFFMLLLLLKRMLPKKYETLPYWIWLALIILWLMTLGFYLNT